MLRSLFRILLLATACFCGQVLAGTNYILEQAYFEDKGNSLSIDQIKNEQFTPYEGWLAKGYSLSTYWIRLSIKSSNDDLIVRIRPPYAESIQVFDGTSLSPTKSVGAKYPWVESDIPVYSHHFKLGPDLQERQIFLKVKYPRTYLLNFDVMPTNEFLRADHIDSLVYMGYIVFTFALALGLFGAWLINPERVLGIFAVQQFFAFLHTFFVVGYARIFFDEYIDISILNYLSYVLVVAYPLIGIVANKFLIEEYGLKRLYRYLFNSLICGSCVVIGLLFLGFTHEALRLNAHIVMLAMTVFCLAAWFGTDRNNKFENINLPIHVVRVYYLLNLVLWSISILPLLGLIQAKDFTVHSYLLYNVFSSLIFFLLLQYRARSILKMELIKSATLKKEASNERFLREEQGKLMAMLTHEIRTPLSVLKLVMDRKVAGSDLEGFANRAVSNIDSIIDKCIQLDQLDLKALKIQKACFNLNELIAAVIADSGSGERIHIQSQSVMEIDSDADLMRVIISNLVGNAMRYSPPHSDIFLNVGSVFSKVGHAGIQILVKNEVLRTDKPDISQVFDKYYRGPSSTKISGSGLGLFLVKELSHALGGEAHCAIIDHSITFRVWIPI